MHFLGGFLTSLRVIKSNPGAFCESVDISLDRVETEGAMEDTIIIPGIISILLPGLQGHLNRLIWEHRQSGLRLQIFFWIRFCVNISLLTGDHCWSSGRLFVACFTQRTPYSSGNMFSSPHLIVSFAVLAKSIFETFIALFRCILSAPLPESESLLWWRFSSTFSWILNKKASVLVQVWMIMIKMMIVR